jgi:copper homeostasis protein
MGQKLILEIAVESLAAAQAAERGGADRIEFCADLSCGGLTPSAETMRQVREVLRIPIHTMIRPRSGSFVYTEGEYSRMKESIQMARAMKMDGVVCGMLREGKTIDVERTKKLVEWARPLKLTFHRAFDECKDQSRSIEDVIQTGAERILTSGGEPDVIAGLHSLQKLIETARERIVILPGGGITPDNFAKIVRETGAREFHSGLGSVLRYGGEDFSRIEEEVRKLVRAGRTESERLAGNGEAKMRLPG